ncbi:outer membrane beta-barrel protein [Duncaniella muris]|uniref:outer membrane beta-barrel protein n=1 Tax=Duncaniella muris TaxID=2094150 RepID=UPI0034A196AA
MDDKSMSDIVPLFNLDIQYAFNQKNSLNLSASYNCNFVDQSDKTPTLLQENELLYKTGNPDLENTRWSSVDLQYTWLPNNMFQVTASGGWSRYFDRPVLCLRQRLTARCSALL